MLQEHQDKCHRSSMENEAQKVKKVSSQTIRSTDFIGCMEVSSTPQIPYVIDNTFVDLEANMLPCFTVHCQNTADLQVLLH